MNNIYRDISERTHGDIYIGVVGPVRSGKSTFVSNFMSKLILPNIADPHEQERARDELPQSADGKTIMTTQPKFVPNTAVKLALSDKSTANVRLIDCVGYLVEGAEGHLEGDKMRLVNTPWSTEPIPFAKAAEIGTQKVATEHSTVAVVVTTDGSIGDIPRQNYVAAEERVVRELKQSGKPFVVVLNCKKPGSERVAELANGMQDKYGVSVLPLNVQTASESDLESVLSSILGEFAVARITMDLPMWMRALPKDNSFIAEILERIRHSCDGVCRMKDADKLISAFDGCEFADSVRVGDLDMGSGIANYVFQPKPDLFFKVLSDEAQTEISDEYTLMSFVTGAAYAKQRYEHMKNALDEADANGYGIVCPDSADMRFEEPQIVKQGNIYGVRLKASSPSYHIIKVDVTTEVSPMVGTEQQSQYLLSEYKQNPEAVWNTNMFGKTMAGLAREGLEGKCNAMPTEVKQKLCKTVNRIVNENRGGLFCLIL